MGLEEAKELGIEGGPFMRTKTVLGWTMDEIVSIKKQDIFKKRRWIQSL